MRRLNMAGLLAAALGTIGCFDSDTEVHVDVTGQVEGILVPMPHFGALLGWSEFEALAGRIRAAGLPFILEPRIRYAGQPGEQATMFLLDPSDNALEFKSFRHPEHVFTA